MKADPVPGRAAIKAGKGMSQVGGLHSVFWLWTGAVASGTEILSPYSAATALSASINAEATAGVSAFCLKITTPIEDVFSHRQTVDSDNH